MDVRRVAAAIGAGTTVALMTFVAVAESIDIAFSAIVALPVALLAGSTVLLAVGLRYRWLGDTGRAIVDGLAGVGVAAAVTAAVVYVGPVSLSLPVAVGVAVLVGVVVALWSAREP